MNVKTREQKYLVEAMKHVRSLQTAGDEERAKKYGVLCHKLPIMIRNDGLAQTLAWVEEKSSAARNPAGGEPSPLAGAYDQLRTHIAATLGLNDANQLVSTIEKASAVSYLRDTSTLLQAWVYYKRFAVSLLGVEASDFDDTVQEMGETP